MKKNSDVGFRSCSFNRWLHTRSWVAYDALPVMSLLTYVSYVWSYRLPTVIGELQIFFFPTSYFPSWYHFPDLLFSILFFFSRKKMCLKTARPFSQPFSSLGSTSRCNLNKK